MEQTKERMVDLPKMNKLKEEYSHMTNDLNFVFLWMQRELLASQTLSDLAIKNRKRDTEDKKRSCKEEESRSTEEEEESSGSSKEDKKPTDDGWAQYIPPSKTTSSTLETINNTEKNVLASPNSTKIMGDEMLDIAHALEDLHWEPTKKRSTNSPMESQLGQKPKKRRRRRHEIARNFKCSMSSCSKSYGSEGALKTHIRLKHSEPEDKRKIRESSNSVWTVASTAGAPIQLPQLPNVLKSLAGDALPLPNRMAAAITTDRMEDNLRLHLPKIHQVDAKVSELPSFNSLFYSNALPN